MKNDIQEDYVSFEIAKLLKEKGFDVNTLFYYWGSGEQGNGYVGKLGSYDGCYNRAKFDYPKNNICAMPTHALAIKWLIENFGIYIISAPNVEKSGFTWMGYNIKNNKNFDSFILPQDVWIFNTPEETTEAALLYTLQNLIL